MIHKGDLISMNLKDFMELSIEDLKSSNLFTKTLFFFQDQHQYSIRLQLKEFWNISVKSIKNIIKNKVFYISEDTIKNTYIAESIPNSEGDSISDFLVDGYKIVYIKDRD